jgi:hypothetical protein
MAIASDNRKPDLMHVGIRLVGAFDRVCDFVGSSTESAHPTNMT